MSGASARADDEMSAALSRDALLADAASLTHYLSALLAPPLREPVASVAADEAALIADPRFHGSAPRQAAVLAPLYAREGRPYLLFTRRAPNLSSHSGEISFPGGSREPVDGSLAQTALRETQEELGLDRSRVTLLGALPSAYTVVSNFLVTPYVGWLGEGLPALRPQASEVAEIIEAPLSALDDDHIYHEELWTHGGRPTSSIFTTSGPIASGG